MIFVSHNGDVSPQRQVINLRSCCIWLVDSVECMMMHGLANPKFLIVICFTVNRANCWCAKAWNNSLVEVGWNPDELRCC